MQIDVIVPVFNQGKALSLVLEALTNQVTDHKYNVIVVDDGSDEDISNIVSMYRSKSILYVRQENRGRSSARNHGASLSEADLLIFNDCDRVPDSNFVQQHSNFRRRYTGLVIGTPKELYIHNWSENTSKVFEIVNNNAPRAKLTSFTQNVISIYQADGSTDSNIPWVSTFSGNMSIERRLFIEHMFDERFINWGLENIELGYRLYKAGVPFQYNKNAVNYHLAHRRPKDFYQNGVEYSMDIIHHKHGYSPLSHVGEFILGSLSLQDYEINHGNFNASWHTGVVKPLYNRLF